MTAFERALLESEWRILSRRLDELSRPCRWSSFGGPTPSEEVDRARTEYQDAVARMAAIGQELGR